MPRAVVFDMDGLMFDTEEVYTRVGCELLRRRGCEFTAELKQAMMGMPPQAAFEMMIRWHSLPDTWDALVPESNALFLELLGKQPRVLPGLWELLAALEQAAIPKAVATSSGRELCEACLRPLDLMRRFQFVLTAEDIVHGKPDPEVYLLAAKRFGMPPGELLVLEDSQNGCRAAAAAGAFAVAVPGEQSRNHDFSGVQLVAESLADPRLYAVLGLTTAGVARP